MSGSSNQQEIVDVARVAGWAAARLCRAVQDSMAGEALYKDAREPVTVADYGSQAVILEAVARVFPDHGVVSEEGAEHLRQEAGPELQKLVTDLTGEILGRSVEFDDVCSWIDHEGSSESAYTWVIDPIDGTMPFLSGLPHWCVAVALVEGERTQSAATFAPVTGEFYAARRGRGATLDGAPLRLGPEIGIAGRMTAIGASDRTDPAHVARVIAALMEAGGLFYRSGSGALMLAAVAAGRLAGYYEPHMNAWDCLGGLLMIEEAGGRVEPFAMPAMLAAGGRVIAAAPAAWSPLCRIAGLA